MKYQQFPATYKCLKVHHSLTTWMLHEANNCHEQEVEAGPQMLQWNECASYWHFYFCPHNDTWLEYPLITMIHNPTDEIKSAVLSLRLKEVLNTTEHRLLLWGATRLIVLLNSERLDPEMVCRRNSYQSPGVNTKSVKLTRDSAWVAWIDLILRHGPLLILNSIL